MVEKENELGRAGGNSWRDSSSGRIETQPTRKHSLAAVTEEE